MPIASTSNKDIPEYTNDENYMGNENFIYALDDKVFTLPGEYMAEIKNKSLHTNKLQDMFGEQPTPQEIITITEKLTTYACRNMQKAQGTIN